MASLSTSILVLLLAVGVIFYLRPKPGRLDAKVLNGSYDYIVVGGGSAGAVVANRLSEDADTTVLLLEAGGFEDENMFIKIPFTPVLVQGTDQDWGYKSVPQKDACKAFKEQKSAWPRGRVLGGTSNLNYMVYIRGSRHDYDSWAAEGCDGWSYKDVLPYFIKSEDIRIPELKNSVYHGSNGPLVVSSGLITPLSEVYREATEELGFKTVDCNGEEQEGFCYMQSTIDGHERCGTGKAFIHPILGRTNFHLSINSIATKILIENKKAVGVEFIRDGRKHRVMANKEIIVSGGAVNSPQLLMLSGIGPKSHLESLKIKVHADLPVGNNLQDHLYSLIWFTENSSYSITKEKLESTWSLMNYFVLGKGYFSRNGLEGSVFVKTDKTAPEKFPDVQLHFFSVTPAFMEDEESKKVQKALSYKDVFYETAMNEVINLKRNFFGILPILIHPKSKGTIRLKSTDPFDPPIIDPHYLEHPDDVKVLVRALRLSVKVANTTAFRKLGTSPEDPQLMIPFCKEHVYNTDAYWECVARHFTMTVYHPTSTCRMGKEDDPTAVVDPQLRVKGISNLRVADASVMRNVPSGNTNAPAIMIGEKMSDMIRGKDTVSDIRKRIEKVIS